MECLLNAFVTSPMSELKRQVTKVTKIRDEDTRPMQQEPCILAPGVTPAILKRSRHTCRVNTGSWSLAIDDGNP